MGIASLSRSPLLSVLLAPLQALAALWMPVRPAVIAPSCAPAATFRRRAANDPSAGKATAFHSRPVPAAGHKPCQSVAKTTAPRRLKVVREFEAGISPACAGRMVISGRMADVCAELDRMAQRETAQAA